MLRSALHPVGFVTPCQPSSAPRPPTGDGWLHEIKHDGFRLLAYRGGDRVRLFTRNGNDWSSRYPLVLATMHGLRTRSCLIDGELVVTGVSCFERLRSRLHDETAFLYAFDILELDGKDLRREPLTVRKAALASVVVQGRHRPAQRAHRSRRRASVRLRLQARPGRHRLQTQGFGLSLGPSRDWLKTKNPASDAVRRETFEDWGFVAWYAERGADCG
jgi:bifunctional non-homologous end joining protein LigD